MIPNEKYELISNALMDRLQLNKSEEASLKDVLRAFVLQDMLKISQHSMLLVTPQDYIEILRAIADALELLRND